MRSSSFRCAGAALGLAWALLADGAGAQPLQVPWPGAADLELVLEGPPEAPVLAFPDGSRLALVSPAAARLTSLVSLVDEQGEPEWMAAGENPTRGGSELFLLHGTRTGSRSVTVPRPRRDPPAALRSGPVLLASGGRLEGLAWLEGDAPRRFEVWAADWDGERFVRSQQVAGRAPGSQLALSGAALDDGSWLLVWSAFDGEDDELVYRRRLGGQWQPIGRVVSADNAVPDITPKLRSTGSGALLAWSRFDGGDYRLVLARFEAEQWRDERFVGPPGSLYPAWSGPERAPRLAFLEASPRAWSVLELDVNGALVRRARLESAARETPIVEAAPGGVTLRFRPPDRPPDRQVETHRARWQ